MRKGIIPGVGVFVLLLIYLLAGNRGTVSCILKEERVTLAKRDIVPFLETLEARWKRTPLRLVIAGKAFEVPKDALRIRWNIKAMKKKVAQGKRVPLLVEWDEEKAKALLESLATKTLLPPQDAFWEGNRVQQARAGRRLNVEKALHALKQSLEDWSDTVTLETFDVLPPRVDTSEVLKSRGITTLLASFATSLKDREEDVVFNIEKAAASLSGYLLKKGEVFSFNAVVGRAEKEDGYRKTRILANGRLVPGYGGGVCQVASTLYNALLRTEAEILERHPHSGYASITAYVPPGLDAAVSYGSKDLRFRFPSQDVVILAYLREQELVCEIWGERENPVTTTVTQKLLKLAKTGEAEGTLTVETVVQRTRSKDLRFVDTYLIPWDFAPEVTRYFSGS